MRPNRLHRIGPASAPPRWAGCWRTRWRLLRQVVQVHAVLNAGGSCTLRHEGRFTDNPPGIAMELPRHASRPAPQGAAGVFSPVVGWLTWPALVGKPEKPSGGMPSRPHLLSERFGPRRPCLVVNPGRGTAAPRASWLQPSGENNFPAATRLPRAANSFRLPVLHCVSTASGAASPSPPARTTTRTRGARTLFN